MASNSQVVSAPTLSSHGISVTESSMTETSEGYMTLMIPPVGIGEVFSNVMIIAVYEKAS